MKNHLYISLIVVLVNMLILLPKAWADISATERGALIALYNSTGGDTWSNNRGWKEPPLDADGFALPGTEDGWYGINTDTGNSTVIEIDLWANNLVGTLPDELGALSNLQRLDLHSNQLTGSIPASLGALSNLEWLDLYSNQLTGSIPSSLGDLSNLDALDLGLNQLTGSIPSSLGDLSNLEELDLGLNQLTGSIPASLGDLSNLEELYLDLNQLRGPIPRDLGNLSALRMLFLNNNELMGPIPVELANLTNLQSGGLNLRYNHLFTRDDTLLAFLNSKQSGGDWESYQTPPFAIVAPTVMELLQ